ncbi:MAG: hypothetical protein EOP89_02535, partial [Lysobacteraceae bacterium]
MKRSLYLPLLTGLVLLVMVDAAPAQTHDTIAARDARGRLGIPAARVTLAVKPATKPYYRVRVAHGGHMLVE